MNNCDMSSSGVSLGLNCSYDADLAQIYFEDEITIIDGNYIFSDKDYDIYDADNYTFTVKSMKELLKKFPLDEKRELADYIHSKNYSKLNKKELMILCEELIHIYYSDPLEVYQDQEYFGTKYDIISIIGYSQGDYADIIIPQTFWHKEHKKIDKNLLSLQSYLSNIFYDQPLNCRLDIDDEEIYLDEQIESIYKYDKDEILTIANLIIEHDKKDYILEWLKSNLPEYPNTY